MKLLKKQLSNENSILWYALAVITMGVPVWMMIAWFFGL